MTDRIASERGSATAPAPIDCDRFDTLLPDYLEHELAPDARSEAEAHLARCARCRALVDDLTAITRSAAAPPPLEPERDLWAGIAARIEAPVIALPAGGARPAGRRRRWASFAAAAAALVIATAGITYVITARVIGARGGAGQQVVVAPVPAPDDVPGAGVGQSEPAESGGGARRDSGAASVPRSAGSVRAVPEATERNEPMVRNVGAERAPWHVAERAYDREIKLLEGILRQRRAELDPATVAVLERNFGVIDAAIAESRAALAKDPASAFLTNQLNTVLEQKLRLLRTAAMLPARS
jgi:hypothetical protein